MIDSSDNGEKVFKPKYEKGLILAVLGVALFFLLSIYIVVGKGVREPMAFAIVGFSGLLIIAMLSKFIRLIRFGPTIVVERYLLPAREFEYSDIVDVGVVTIRTKRGKISLFRIKNAEDLFGILEGCIQKGLILEEQLEGTLAVREALSWTATAYASIIAFVVNIVVVLFCRPCRVVHPVVTYLIVFFVLYYPIRSVLKKGSA